MWPDYGTRTQDAEKHTGPSAAPGQAKLPALAAKAGHEDRDKPIHHLSRIASKASALSLQVAAYPAKWLRFCRWLVGKWSSSSFRQNLLLSDKANFYLNGLLTNRTAGCGGWRIFLLPWSKTNSHHLSQCGVAFLHGTLSAHTFSSPGEEPKLCPDPVQERLSRPRAKTVKHPLSPGLVLASWGYTPHYACGTNPPAGTPSRKTDI